MLLLMFHLPHSRASMTRTRQSSATCQYPSGSNCVKDSRYPGKNQRIGAATRAVHNADGQLARAGAVQCNHRTSCSWWRGAPPTMERQPGEELLRWVEEQGSAVRVPQWGRAAGEPVPLWARSGQASKLYGGVRRPVLIHFQLVNVKLTGTVDCCNGGTFDAKILKL